MWLHHPSGRRPCILHSAFHHSNANRRRDDAHNASFIPPAWRFIGESHEAACGVTMNRAFSLESFGKPTSLGNQSSGAQ